MYDTYDFITQFIYIIMSYISIMTSTRLKNEQRKNV